MKQLYSVGPLARAAAPGCGSARTPMSQCPVFKAGSRGLRPEDVQAALTNVGYATPPGWGGDGAHPLPVRLALLQTPSLGRMLTHVAPNGSSYFAHALLNIPTTADAQLAIKTWGSPHWQRHDPAGAGDLPDLPYLPVADLLDDEALRKWLAEPSRHALLEFVIAALLGAPAETRIVLAATAEDVAYIVYAVTRALPHGLLHDFTFSTYEPDPRNQTIRLIGHDTGSPECDLPEECYSGGAMAFNLASGRQSELPGEAPFAAFAAAALASGKTALLDDLQSTWQQLGLTEARHLDLVFRLSHGSMRLTKEEAAAAVRRPTLTAWIAARPDAVSQFVSWALEDADFAHQSLARLIVPLRQKSDALARLAAEVRQAGLAALTAGDQQRTANALEVILPMAAPARANAAWGELLAQAPDPHTLTWDMRKYLLPRLVRFKHPNAHAAEVDPALTKWLEVPAEQLHDLLALELPRSYHQAAAEACLALNGEPSSAFTRAAAAHPAVALHLLRGAAGPHDDRVALLFARLLTEAPEHSWFEDVLVNAESFSAAARNRLFEEALAAGKVDPEQVIRNQGPTLLALFTGQSGLDQLGRRFLLNPPADIFTNPTLLDFLSKLKAEPLVSAEVKDRIAAVQVVREFLDAPDFTAQTLQPVAAALAAQPPILPASAAAQVLEGLSNELGRRPASSEMLELILLHFGRVLAATPVALYRELLQRQRSRREFGASPHVTHAFLAIALGAAQNDEVARQTDGLEAEAFAIATDAARRGGRRAIAAIDVQARLWPKSARAQWGFLAQAVRPKEIGRSLRELTLFAAGAAAATAVWFVAAQLIR